MNTISYIEYLAKENDFFDRHKVSNIVENGDYKNRVKHYICEDGHQLWEDITFKEFKEKKIVSIEAYGVMFNQEIEVSVKLIVTEIWNTEDSNSYYYLERF